MTLRITRFLQTAVVYVALGLLRICKILLPHFLFCYHFLVVYIVFHLFSFYILSVYYFISILFFPVWYTLLVCYILFQASIFAYLTIAGPLWNKTKVLPFLSCLHNSTGYAYKNTKIATLLLLTIQYIDTKTTRFKHSTDTRRKYQYLVSVWI